MTSAPASGTARQLGGGLGHLGAGLPELDHVGAALAAPLARQLLALRLQAGAALGVAAHVDALLHPGPLQVRIAHGLPAPAQLFQLGGPLGLGQGLARARAVALACAALLRGLGVVPLEVLLRVAVDAVHLSLRKHQVHVRLLATIGGGRYMEGPLVGVPVAYLLAYKLAHQLDPLRGAQLARQGNFHLPVGRAVLALVGVGGLPEGKRVGLRPGGHVARLGRFQLFAAL
jgi:hypothetical protein